MNSNFDGRYDRGVFLVTASAVLWSMSGILIRVIEADVWSTLFYRGVLSAVTISAIIAFRDGLKGFRPSGFSSWPTWMVSCLMAASMLSALASMHYTSVAESMTIFATSPFLTAAFALILIGERPNSTTVCASLVAFCGVLYMVSDNPGGGTGLGRALAVVFTVSTALMSTILRKHREVEMLPSMIMASLICAAAMAPFASFSIARPDDLLYLALFGIVQSGIAQATYTIGARYIPAAVASLLVALEVPLSPLWVWLIINEVPTRTTQIGGAIVLAALVAHISLELLRAKRLKAAQV